MSGCAEFRDVAPELAFGVLDGDERADALAHLASCSDCRVFAESMSGIADSLLLLAPPADPPLGFESRVVAGLRPARRPRTWPRATLVAAAAAIAAALLTFALVRPRNNEPLLRAALAGRSGDVVGRVWAYNGERDWMFMTVDNPWAADNPYVCQVVLKNGRVVTVGRFQAHDGKGAWGEPVSFDVGDVRSVRMLTPDGTTVASARLSS